MHNRYTGAPCSIYHRNDTFLRYLCSTFYPTFNEMHVPEINEDQSRLINRQRHLKLTADEGGFTTRHICRSTILKVADA